MLKLCMCGVCICDVVKAIYILYITVNTAYYDDFGCPSQPCGRLLWWSQVGSIWETTFLFCAGIWCFSLYPEANFVVVLLLIGQGILQFLLRILPTAHTIFSRSSVVATLYASILATIKSSSVQMSEHTAHYVR